LLKPLTHCFDVCGAIDYPGGDRLDALAFAVQRQAGEVLPHAIRRPPASPQPRRQRVHEGRELSIQALQFNVRAIDRNALPAIASSRFSANRATLLPADAVEASPTTPS
jgi:hypothetical protein